MHFAFATNTPSLSLFGPGDPSHYGPTDKSIHKVLYKNLYCSPCIYEVDVPPCKNNNQCMKAILPNEIIFELYNMMPDIFYTKPNKYLINQPDLRDNYKKGQLSR